MRRPIIFFGSGGIDAKGSFPKKKGGVERSCDGFRFQDGWQKEMAWRRDYPGLPDRELSGILLNQMMSFFSR